ncbi:hypothetical protein B7463_g10009, partial [Scytalidium lignicola]
MSLHATITIITKAAAQIVVAAVSSRKKSSTPLVQSEKSPVDDTKHAHPINLFLLATLDTVRAATDAVVRFIRNQELADQLLLRLGRVDQDINDLM